MTKQHLNLMDTKSNKYRFPAFETVMNSVSDGLFITDPKGDIQITNRIFQSWIGLGNAELQNTSYKKWLDFDPEQIFDPLKEIRRLHSLGSQEATALARQAFLYKEGNNNKEPVEVEVTVTPFFEFHACDKRKESFLSWHLKNITQQQQEHDWQEHQQRMLVQQSKLASIGEMTAAIAHQWKQPLNIINGVLINIFEAFESNELTLHYLNHQLRTASLQGKFMSDTVEDFRAFLKHEPHKTTIVVAESIHKALQILQAQIKHQHLDLKILIEDKNLMVLGKTNELQQVLINLVQNAQDAIEERARLSSDFVKGTIKLTLYKKEHEAIIEVSNNGTRIHCENQEKLFEPFFSTKENEGGSGIGLYLSQKLIETSFGGKLSLKHSTEEETTFQICLPILEDSSSQDQ